MDAVHLQDILGTDIVNATPSQLVLQGGGVALTLRGFGFTFDADEQITGGTVTSIDFQDPLGPGSTILTHGQISGLSMPVATLVQYAYFNDNLGAFTTIFAGNDVINGSFGSDLMRGYGGNDTIQSSDFGQDTMYGGAGDDRLVGSALGFNYLNGGPGADTLVAGGNAAGTFFEVGSGESPSGAAAGGHLEQLDHILNWTTDDFVIFTGGAVATSSTYREINAATFDQAAASAQTNLAQGVDYTVAQVGADLVVFDLRLGDAVVISGRTLADISQVDVGGNPALAQPDTGLSPPPPPPPHGAGATVNLIDGADMGAFQESQLSDAVNLVRSSTQDTVRFGQGTAQLSITGAGLTYGPDGVLTGGTVTGLEITSPNGHFVLTGANTDGSILGQAFHSNNAEISTSALMSGDDLITVQGTQSPGADTSYIGMGYGGNDVMVGGGTLSTFSGGDGNDTLQAATAAQSYLRGDAGDDSISGGSGFDDSNGNMGNDTIHGNGGDDWSVGGKDSDLLFGDDGSDIVWGNLGNDTCDGGAGDDQCRGGQGTTASPAGPAATTSPVTAATTRSPAEPARTCSTPSQARASTGCSTSTSPRATG